MRNYHKIKKEQNCNCAHCLLHILLCQKLIDRISHSVSEKKPKPSSKLLIQDPRKTKGKNPVSINFFLFRKNQTKIEPHSVRSNIRRKLPFFYPSILLNLSNPLKAVRELDSLAYHHPQSDAKHCRIFFPPAQNPYLTQGIDGRRR